MSEKAHADDAADALVRLTEWNLATLEWRESLKSSSKSEVKRQRNICEAAVGDCVTFASPEKAREMGAYRLEAIMLGQRPKP
ncbi:hypothetical protein [Myxococcus landrumensis]|uniref:Lipoprotein n=1 Tax=Myxococcus landrumensis TaxID=2813577 RepID=A0ABX7N6M5_9BACT|nr:hypothetical protein [Myxococcus landrumus]QSQ14064.1 hypothetical protein JY572_38080 [Myxococcus landrumus]